MGLDRLGALQRALLDAQLAMLENADLCAQSELIEESER
jgi:hypothetical protein